MKEATAASKTKIPITMPTIAPELSVDGLGRGEVNKVPRVLLDSNIGIP